MSKRKVLIFNGFQELAYFAVEKWVDITNQAIGAKNKCVVAVSGGKTPVLFLQGLACFSERIRWDKIHIFLVDERYVSPDSPESNFNLITENLLKRISIRRENIHPVIIHKTLKDTVDYYEQDLKNFFQLQKGELPVFDLIILGIGQDGHTASLFPGDESLLETKRFVVGVPEAPKHKRVTLTLPVINNGRNHIFLVSGSSKAAIVKTILNGKSRLPVSLINPPKSKVLFLLDKQAASLL